MQRFKIAILTLALSLLSFGGFGFATAAAMPAPHAFGAASAFKQDACSGLNQVDSDVSSNCKGLGKTGSGVKSTIKQIVYILSWVIGVLAVIMIMVAGFRYITSGGESNAVSGAKRGLIYALIGLAVAALAQLLVHFVLANVS